MKGSKQLRISVGLLAALFLSACASTETMIATPTVQLKSVELSKVGFNQQTFLLGFDVSNPNSFPLPVRAVKYRLLFDDKSFANGETQGNFTVPAHSDDEFVLSVNVNLLDSATQLTSLLRGGVPEYVEYELQGSLAIDIPFVRPVPFSNTGVIPVKNSGF
jgi:LEA14-like dessication related protein